MQLLYRKLCPNDGNDIISSRLEKGLVCEVCLPEKDIRSFDFESLLEYLKARNYLKDKLKKYKDLRNQLEEFENKFKVIFENLTSAQRSWFIKAASGESFAITYPTGLGKTSFGILYLLYLAEKNQTSKSFMITPTRVLVESMHEKIEDIAKKTNIKVKIIRSGEKKEELIKKLNSGDFNIAIFTPRFLIANKDYFKKSEFLGYIDFVFVDDVDALLKNSKSIDIILHLIGFEETIVNKAKMLAKRYRKEPSEERSKIIEEIQEYKKNRKIGQLVFSSATTKITSSRIKLLRYLLNFEPGSSLEVFRNIHEFYKKVGKRRLLKECVKLVKSLGSGGLIFISTNNSEKTMEKLSEMLKKENISNAIVSSKTKAKKHIDEFSLGNIEILIGHASFYGPLVRGIDIPAKAKYAIFLGVPKFKFSFQIFEKNPLRTLWLAGIIADYIEDFEKRRELINLADKLRKETERYTPEALRMLSKLEEKSTELRIIEFTKKLYSLIFEILKEEKIIKKLEEKKRLKVIEERGQKFFIVPDSLTYIQASGRTSRMFYAGITTGLSIILVDDDTVFEGLKYQLTYRSELFKFEEFDEFERKKEEIINKIRQEREAIESKNEKALKKLEKFKLKTALFIVESPTKARTISSFFGKPVVRIVNGIRVYECVTDKFIMNITATRGHLFDLSLKHDESNGIYQGIIKTESDFIPIYSTIKKCRNCGEQFTDYLKGEGICIYCGSTNVDDQMKTVEVLQSLAQECDIVIIATDPDSEGEKIAKDVYLALRPFAKEIKRAEMHEITFSAFNKALENLRDIDDKLVNAQILRRIGDRWAGFSLSNVMQEEFKRKTMGVGRVQTPVLKWIVENYLSRIKNKKKLLMLQIRIGNYQFRIMAKLKRKSFWKGAFTIKLKRELKERKIEFSIKEIEEIQNPPRPFSTTDLLTTAIQKMKTSSDKVMRLAQDLFEAGLITYHRTDSHFISNLGFEIAKRYLKEKDLEKLIKIRQYDKPGAHECIRPTRPLDRQELENAISTGQLRIPIQLSPQHYQLYDLIFRTFVASQMKETPLKKYKIKFKPLKLEINGDKVEIKIDPLILNINANEDSFVKIYPMTMYKELEKITERIATIKEVTVIKKIKRLYTEEEIISKMKESGIGRPSTYSIIIKRLIDHGYVIVSPNRRAFIPTKTGVRLIEVLDKYYKWITDVELTREFEETMDKIERGELNEEDVKNKLSEFFQRFYSEVFEKRKEIIQLATKDD